MNVPAGRVFLEISAGEAKFFPKILADGLTVARLSGKRLEEALFTL
jgi:hypothetical protein